ncbi:hypothetical protein H5T87_10210 [bacterium]|nr:hypothetical protein [bacterium]
MELISLIRSSRLSISKNIFLLLAFIAFIGHSFPLDRSALYDKLLEETQLTREASYKNFLLEFEKIKEKKTISEAKEVKVEMKESVWKMLPEKLEEWKKEHSLSLFSLRLKELASQISGKTEEANELQNQLSTTFQSLLSQWQTPVLPTTTQPSENITPALPSPPQPIVGWWKAPQLVGTPLPMKESVIERDYQKLIVSMDREIARHKEEVGAKISRLERSLEEVKRSCPLP